MEELLNALCRDDEDRLVFSLVRYIREKKLKAGDKLPSIRTFAMDFDVSQSQIRSGLMRAAALGLVNIVPRSGCYVSDLRLSNIVGPFALLFEAMYMNERPPLLDLYDLKTTLERGISKRVAKVRTIEDLSVLKGIVDSMDVVDKLEDMILIDEEFHNKLAEFSRNPLFYSLIRIIHSMLRESRLHYRDYVSEYPQSRKDHQELYQAIKNQDELLAGAIAERHSNRRKERLVSDF